MIVESLGRSFGMFAGSLKDLQTSSLLQLTFACLIYDLGQPILTTDEGDIRLR